MDIQVKVTAKARKNFVKKERDLYKVYVTAPAIEGKANQALKKILSKHFDVRRNQIEIIKGEKCREKVIRIHRQK